MRSNFLQQSWRRSVKSRPLPWMLLAGSAHKLGGWVLPPAVERTEVNWLPWGVNHTLASLAPAATNQPHTGSTTQREITGCWASA